MNAESETTHRVLHRMIVQQKISENISSSACMVDDVAEGEGEVWAEENADSEPTYTIEDMSEDLRNLLISCRMQQLTDKLLNKKVFGLITLYCLSDEDLAELRQGLKPVEMKRFDSKIAKLVIDQRAEQSNQLINVSPKDSFPTEEQSAQELLDHFYGHNPDMLSPAPMEIDPAYPALQPESTTEAVTITVDSGECESDSDVDEKEVSPESTWTREEIEQQIEEAIKCTDIINCIIAQEESEYDYCDYASKNIRGIPIEVKERLQASKERHLDRLRILKRHLETAPSGGALPPAASHTKTTPLSTAKRRVYFSLSTTDTEHHVLCIKDEEYARKLQEEENLKLLREKEKERFRELQKQEKLRNTWSCELCKQTNPEHLYQCKDCKQSRGGFGSYFQRRGKHKTSSRQASRHNPNHYSQRHAAKIERDMTFYGGGYNHNCYSSRTHNNSRNSYASRGVYCGDSYSHGKGYVVTPPIGANEDSGVLSSMISGMKSFFGGCTTEDEVSAMRDVNMRQNRGHCDNPVTPANPSHSFHAQHAPPTYQMEDPRREWNSSRLPTSPKAQPQVQGAWVGGPPTIAPDSHTPIHTTIKCQRDTKTAMYETNKRPLRENHFASEFEYNIL